VCIISKPASAQDILRPQPQMIEGVRGITAFGHGEIKAKPDIAYATIGVTIQDRDQVAAVNADSLRSKAVMAALKSSQIADKDMQTQYYTVQPQYDYRISPALLTGYQVTNSIQVTFRDLSKIGIVLDKVTKAGATDVGGVSFDLADRSRVEGDALALAVANARRKADLMAGAAGVTLGKIISVSEGQRNIAQPIPMMRAMAAGPMQDTSTTIVPQQIEVTADATIVYSIESK